MGDGGGGGGGATGNRRSSASLDGAFLLQLLRNPPQSQTQPQSSSHQTLNNDPAVAAVGPTTSSSSPFFIHHHHHHHFSPPQPQPPPGFHRRAPPPGFPPHPSGSPHPLGPPPIHHLPPPPPLVNSQFSASPPPSFSARDLRGNSKVLGSRAAAHSNVDGGGSSVESSYWQKLQNSMQAAQHHVISFGNFGNVVAQRQEMVERQDGRQQNADRRELNHGQGNGLSLLQRELNEGNGLGSRRGGIEERDELADIFEELMVTGESSVEKRSNSSRSKVIRLYLRHCLIT